MGIEWIDPPSEPGYRRPEGGQAPSFDFQQYENRRRAAVQRENALVLVGGAAAGVALLWWILRRRAAIGRATIEALGAAEHARRQAAATAKSLADRIKAEADKRG